MVRDAEYWNERYANNQIGWDLGMPSPPIQAYFDQIEDKNVRILIPGSGNAYDAELLFEKGFENVYVLDFAQHPLDAFKKRNPAFPSNQLIYDDFFKYDGEYDFIAEQTLYCAIDPSMRDSYAEQSSSLLKKGGKLVGVLFNREFEEGPPFGGNSREYAACFAPHFESVELFECYNSVVPRLGSELFIRMTK